MLRKFNKVNFTSRIDHENPTGFSWGRNAPYLRGTGKTFYRLLLQINVITL